MMPSHRHEWVCKHCGISRGGDRLAQPPPVDHTFDVTPEQHAEWKTMIGRWVRVTSTIGWPPRQGWLQAKRVGGNLLFFFVDRDLPPDQFNAYLGEDFGRTFYLSGACRVALATKPPHRKEPPPPVRNL